MRGPVVGAWMLRMRGEFAVQIVEMGGDEEQGVGVGLDGQGGRKYRSGDGFRGECLGTLRFVGVV